MKRSILLLALSTLAVLSSTVYAQSQTDIYDRNYGFTFGKSVQGQILPKNDDVYKDIQNWVTGVAMDVNTYDHKNIDEVLTKNSVHFAPDTWELIYNNMNRSGIYDMVKQNYYKAEGSVRSEIVVISERMHEEYQTVWDAYFRLVRVRLKAQESRKMILAKHYKVKASIALDQNGNYRIIKWIEKH